MSYKRAEWHSGLTYRQTCETCKTTVEYQDTKLGFRPWYPDGFVYCPTCKNPLRHNENYAIDRPVEPEANNAPVFTEATAENGAAFCSHCGKAFKPGDHFCSGCGSRREEESEAPAFDEEAPVFEPAESVAGPAAPVFTLAEPVAEEIEASGEEPGPAEPVIEPAEPEFCVPYAAPAPAVVTKKYALKEKMPIVPIILLALATTVYMISRIGFSAMGIFDIIVRGGALAMMLIGMILHKKKGQTLVGVGTLCIAFSDIINLLSRLRYINFSNIVDFLAIGAYVIAGIYYLCKAPVLGMPIKLIAFLLFLTVFSVVVLLNFVYYPGYILVRFAGNYLLAAALIIYTPFKRAKA